MARKRQSAPENPSSDSDSSEEIADSEQQNPKQIQYQNPNCADSSESDDEESSDEEDGEEERQENKKPSGTKSAQPQSDSDSEDETVSDTGSSDSAPPPSSSAVKNQLKNDVAKTQISAQNPNASASKSDPEKENAKGKPMSGVGEEKKSPFARLWSDDDELAIVRGMDDFRKEIGRDPCVDKDGFFEFLKKSLKFEASKSQLMDKIRRLKNRYHNNAKKGENLVFSKPHELKLFELSKNVWGGDGSKPLEKRKVVNMEGVEDLVSKSKKPNKKAKTSMDLADNLKGNEDGFWEAYPCFKEALEIENSGYYFKEGGSIRAMMVELSKFGAVKAKEMEAKWMGFYAKEMELKLLWSELVKEQTKLVLDALNAAKP